ncbi:MAG: tetratricopeptide repeat protein [Aureispira sp.]|nr:tetratricopeptide repeat protein [Aureispira sp.]
MIQWSASKHSIFNTPPPLSLSTIQRFLIPIFFLLSSTSQAQLDSLFSSEYWELANDSIKVELLNDLAWDLQSQDAKSALRHANTALLLAQQIGDVNGEATAYSILGVLYDILGKNAAAIPFHLEAIKLYEQLDDQYSISACYTNLGVSYYSQHHIKNALLYYTRALEIEEKIGDWKGMAGSYINIGNVYKQMDSLDAAAIVYSKASQTYSTLGYQKGALNTKVSIAGLYLKQKDYQKAASAYDTILNALEKTFYPDIALKALDGSAQSCLALGLYDKAIDYAQQELHLAKNSNNLLHARFTYQTLAEAYEKTGNHQQALVYHKLYTSDQFKELNTVKIEKQEELRQEYESEKQQRKIIEMQLKNQREIALRRQTEYQAQQRKIERNVWITLSGLILCLAFLLYYRYQSKQKINRLLTEKNKIITQSLDDKEMLIGEVHHRVKNNLQLISSILELQARHLTNQEAIQAINDSQQRVESVAIIHQKLYQQEQEDIQAIQMQDYINQLLQGLFDSYQYDTQHIEWKMDIAPLYLDVNTSIPIGLMITELITNIFKYAFPTETKGSVWIKLHKPSKEYIELIVKDNGVGVSDTIDSSKSFGMRLIKSLSRQLRATLSIENKEGTCITVQIKRFKELTVNNSPPLT